MTEQTLNKKIEEFMELKQERDEIEARMGQLRQELLEFGIENGYSKYQLRDVSVSIRETLVDGFSKKQLKEELPEVYLKYCKPQEEWTVTKTAVPTRVKSYYTHIEGKA